MNKLRDARGSARVRSVYMRVIPLGATGGEVTGSAFLVETRSAAVLVDCGMFQGGRAIEQKNRTLLPYGSRLNGIVVTHAHLDHVGRIPLLFREKIRVPCYATPATTELATLILRDAAHLIEQDVARQNRRRQRSGKPAIEPLYTPDDAEAAIAAFRPVPYRKPVEIADGIEADFSEAGHLLGSASIRLTVREGQTSRRLVFSGDLGPKGAPILKDYEPFHHADWVFIESTYGDRDHRPFADTVEEFKYIVQKTVREGGKMFMPTFSVGRAQVMTMLLAAMFRNGEVPRFPVYLDSPMAIEASRITMSHPELFDDEMTAFLHDGSIEEDLRTFHVTRTVDESRQINDAKGPCLVIAGSGMCTGGRILHHLKHNLWRPETHVIFVGYQAAGTLGRQLVDGARTVRLLGEQILVRAHIHTLGGFSAHAGQKDLLEWMGVLAPAAPRVAVVHGEPVPRDTLAARITERFGLAPIKPDRNIPIEM